MRMFGLLCLLLLAGCTEHAMQSGHRLEQYERCMSDNGDQPDRHEICKATEAQGSRW